MSASDQMTATELDTAVAAIIGKRADLADMVTYLLRRFGTFRLVVHGEASNAIIPSAFAEIEYRRHSVPNRVEAHGRATYEAVARLVVDAHERMNEEYADECGGPK